MDHKQNLHRDTTTTATYAKKKTRERGLDTESRATKNHDHDPQVRCLTAEKDALQRFVQSEFQIGRYEGEGDDEQHQQVGEEEEAVMQIRGQERNFPLSDAYTSDERDLERLAAENGRLRSALDALATELERAQAAVAASASSSSLHPSRSSVGRSPLDLLHSPDIADPFRSPLSNNINYSAIDTSFPPLMPDLSFGGGAIASTSRMATAMEEEDEAVLAPLPLSPPSPFLFSFSPRGSSPSSPSTGSHINFLDTDLEMDQEQERSMSLSSSSFDPEPESLSLSNEDGDDDDIEDDPLLSLRQAELEAQLSIERLEAENRQREMEELMEAIDVLVVGAGLGRPPPGAS